MADAGIAALSPEDDAAAFANLPPVNVPSIAVASPQGPSASGDQQSAGNSASGPLHINITKGVPKAPDWYASLPDVSPSVAQNDGSTPNNDASAQNQPQKTPVAPSNDKTASPNQAKKAPDWYNALPNASAVPSPAPPTQQGQKPTPGLIETVGDAGQQFGVGVGEGVVGLTPPGLVLNLSALAQRGLDYAADHTIEPAMDYVGAHVFGETPERQAQIHAMQQKMRINIPTTNDIIRKAFDITGAGLPEPKTTAGEYANTAGQFFAGPGGIIPKLAGAFGSETAGQLTKGTPLETPARVLGGIVGGGGAATVTETGKSLKTAAQNAGIGAKENIPDAVNPNGPPIPATQAQLQTATQGVLNSATDKAAVLQQLQNKPIEAPLGVQPTLGEHVDDQGIAQAQNAIRQKAPEPFQQRAQDRGTAIATKLEDMSKAGNPASIGDYIGRLVKEDGEKSEAQRGQLADTAQGKMNAIGHYGEEVPEGETPTGQAVTDARAVRKGITKDKYKILDSVNGEDADMVTVRNRANDIEQQSQQYLEAPLGKTIKKLVDDILNPPEGAKDTVKTLRTLRSRISKAQRSLGMDERADMSHLQDLKVTVDKALQNTVEGLALKNKTFYDKLSDALHETSQQAVAESQGAGRNARVTVQGTTAKSAPLFSGKAGAKGKAGERPPNDTGGESVPEETPNSRFGQQQLDAYKDANQTYARFSTIGELENRGIIDANGSLNETKFTAWRNKPKNAERLNADPEFRDALGDAAKSKGKLDDFVARETERLETFQKSRLAKFLPHDADAPAIIGRIFGEMTTNAAKVFKELTDKISKDPEAMAAWQAATSKYINDRIARASVEESAGKTVGRVARQDSLREFIQQNKEALREIYRNGQGLNNLEQAAALIRRAQEFERRANIPGQSNTAKNAAQMARHGTEARMYDYVGKMLRGGGAFIGAHVFGPAGAAGGEILGENLASALKSNRFNTVEKIQLAMYAHPELTKALAERFGAKTPPLPLQNRVAAQMRMLLPSIATASDDETVKREPSSTRR